MPDLTEDVIYRNFTVNDASIRENIVPGGGRLSGISGSILERMDISNIEYVQFMEKRSESDGMDAGPVWASIRRISMYGVLFDVSRSLLEDRKNTLFAAFSPTLAMRSEPAALGYQPLYFTNHTSRVADYAPVGDDEFGKVTLMIRARTASVTGDDSRDRDGGIEPNPLAWPYAIAMVARDPSIMGSSPQNKTLTGSDQVTTLTNRGNYHVPLNMLFTITSHAGVMTVNVAGSIFTLTFPTGAGNRVVRVDGKQRVVYIDDVLAMGVIDFPGAIVWPLVGSGTPAFTVTYTGGLVLTGSDNRAWFWEGYA